jgi:L-2-hydroxyglutarate oxidase LhgO
MIWGSAQDRREGEKDADFVIQGPAEHGIAGLVSLFGIESPGLTACLAIADELLDLLR